MGPSTMALSVEAIVLSVAIVDDEGVPPPASCRRPTLLDRRKTDHIIHAASQSRASQKGIGPSASGN